MLLQYQEYQPTEALRPYVVSYWSMYTDGTSEEQTPLQRCFPAGTIEWITQVRGRNMQGLRDGQLFEYPGSIFTGICNKASEWYGYGDSELFGVRFTPEGAIRLFGAPLTEYHNSFLDTADLFDSRLTPILSQLRSANTVSERIFLVESFLYNLARNKELDRNYFHEALRLIRSSDNLQIAELPRKLYVCERQLQRSFRQQLGISPKGYFRIVRLYKAHQLGLIRQENYSHIAYQLGYSDPAHFSRDFKDYFGVSPDMHFSSINMKWVA